MKKNYFYYLVMILAIVALAACNTSDEQSKADESEDTNGTDTGELIETDDELDNPTEKDEQVNEEEPKSTSNKDSNTNANSNSDTAKVGVDNYTIELLEGFTFTPEEPGKDVILYEENDQVYLRIESLTKNDTTYADLVDSTKEWMAAVSEDYETNNIDELVKDENFANIDSFIANFDESKVVTVVFEKGNLLVRLTSFDLHDVNLTDKLLKMGFTIEEK